MAVFSQRGYPLVIMTTVPIAIAGGIVGSWTLNIVGGRLPALGLMDIRQSFDMITMLGFLILAGTVVNNPVLLVDRALNELMNELMGSRIEALSFYPSGAMSRLLRIKFPNTLRCHSESACHR